MALFPLASLVMHLQLLSLQGHSSGTSPMSSSVQSGTPITNDLFSQALQHALQASGQPSLQVGVTASSFSPFTSLSDAECRWSFQLPPEAEGEAGGITGG